MPQLDIYTFPTQIYFVAVFFAINLILVVKFLTTLFFKIELLEKEAIHTFDDAFLIQTAQYGRSPRTPSSIFSVFERFLLTPKI